MDRERAETYLRLLAEAELRRATTMAARSSSGRWPSARLVLAARALSAVGAVGPPWALSAPASRIRSRPTPASPSRCDTGYLPGAPARTASGRHPSGGRGGSCR